MRIEIVEEHWPEAISDGLTLSCQVCGKLPVFDYTVDDDAWRNFVPKEMWLGVVCLGCFSKLVRARDRYVSEFLKAVQFTGADETILLVPAVAYRYDTLEEARENETPNTERKGS